MRKAMEGMADALKGASAEEIAAVLQGLDADTKKRLEGALAGAKSGPAKGKGDMDTVVLHHSSGASAEIYLFGGTLCSYKTSAGKEQIFVSPGAIFDGKKAIRGGVPLVFPQFGQPDKAMAQHGFARSSVWAIKEVTDSDSESVAILSLGDSEATKEKWPHAFALEYIVSLNAERLKMTMKIENTGDAPFKFHALLHTYFAIPDCAEAAVCGLTGREYIDKVAGGETKKQEEAEILLPSFTDRVYIGDAPEAKVVNVAGKGGGARLFEITNEATIAGEVKPCDVVVWNPYEEASPGDLPPPAFKNFVCVEPGLVSDFSELAPKAIAELSQTVVAK